MSAANNVLGPSYPSLFATVISTAAHDLADPSVWFYNPTPPVKPVVKASSGCLGLVSAMLAFSAVVAMF